MRTVRHVCLLIALGLTGLSSASCTKERPVLSLVDGAGISVGARVFAEGVMVGEVQEVQVSEGRVVARVTWKEGHTLALRADACAVVLGPEVVIFPGKDLVPLSPPVPSCREDAVLAGRVKSLSQGGNQAVAEAATKWFERHRRSLEPAGLEPCGALEVTRARTEAVDAVPLLLPSGGKRVWLTLENRSDSPLSLSTARFVDARGFEAPHAHLPDDDALFMSIALPPRSRREVSAVFEDTRDVSAIEFEATSPLQGGACRSRWPF
ncbi:MAG: hypothetical protein U0228_35705 [Myxococcaceae bacterium]